jgi:hypothetical protein
MATLSFVKSQCFVEALAEKNHNLGSDTLKICLMSSAPSASTDTNYTTHWASKEIASGNGYTTTGATVTITSSSQTTGTYTLVVSADVSWTATPAAMAGFRYLGLYNSTATGANCIGYWDHGSTITLGIGETYLADIGGTT